MNVLEAMTETVRVAEEVHRSQGHMPPPRINYVFFDHPSIGYAHIYEMYNRALSEQMSETKLNRWLGWMQCAICTWTPTVTIEDMKAINRRWT